MRPHRRGVIVLFTVLVLGVSSLAAMSVVARGTLESFVDTVDAQKAWGTRAKVFGCLDEVLIQLQKDNDYAPASVFIGSATCTATVTTPASGQRTVVLSLNENALTRQVTATVTLSPFAVTQVTEP